MENESSDKKVVIENENMKITINPGTEIIVSLLSYHTPASLEDMAKRIADTLYKNNS